MLVREELGEGSILFGEGDEETLERQARYLELLNAQPFIKHIAALTRDLMGIKRGSIIADIGSANCPDLADINAKMEGQGVVHLCDPNEPLLRMAAKLDEPAIKTVLHPVGVANLSLESPLADATRAIRTIQQIDKQDGEEAVKAMVRATKAGGRIVIVDPVWFDLNIVNADIAPDELETIVFWGSNPVKNPDAAKLTRFWLNAAGAQKIETHDVVLKTSTYERANLATGMERQLAAMLKAKAIDGEVHDSHIAKVSSAMRSGRAYMEFPYRVTVGHAPAP